MTTITISYLGFSCFKFEVKNHEEVDFVTDPFSKTDSLKLPKNLFVDFVTISSQNPLHNAAEFVKPKKEKIKTISNPGEYEIKGVFINGMPCVTKDKNGKIIHTNTIYNFLINDIQITHLGSIVKSLSDEEIQGLGNCDVLLLPISPDPEISVKDSPIMKNLVDIVNRVEPRILIPMHFKMSESKINLNPLDKFLKEIGQTKVEPLKKFKFSKKDLPEEEMKVMVLTKD